MKKKLLSKSSHFFPKKRYIVGEDGYFFVGYHCGMGDLFRSLIAQDLIMGNGYLAFVYDDLRDFRFMGSSAHILQKEKVEHLNINQNLYYYAGDNFRDSFEQIYDSLSKIKLILYKCIEENIKDKTLYFFDLPMDSKLSKDVFEIINLAKKTGLNVIYFYDAYTYGDDCDFTLKHILSNVKTTILLKADYIDIVKKHLDTKSLTQENLSKLQWGKYYIFENNILLSDIPEQFDLDCLRKRLLKGK